MNSKRHKEQQMRLREWMAAAKPILDKWMQMLVEEREQEERQITDFFTRTF
jgi:hypothetical protein|tara:strand:- start:16 stop:168 length:153 start_codon:yes stop_codon:yes gene_type:complete